MTHSRRNDRLALAITQILSGSLVVASAAMPALAAAADSADASDGLQDIVVTAQRRPESILDVPYNISAVSGQTIEDTHVMDAAELMRSIPGVSVVDRGDRNSSVINGIRIRGLNVDSSALGDYAVSAAATVSTYVDETPIFANFLLTDIERVEVLKGPQGTLYGSGAIGGTVRYIMNPPELGTWGGEISASGSHVQGSGEAGVSVTGVLNVPLGDTLALRLTGTHNIYPGVTDYVNLYKLDSHGVPVAPQGILSTAASYYSQPDADWAHQDYGRLALRFKPNDQADVTLAVTGQSDRFGGRRATTLGTNGDGVPYGENQLGSVQLEPSSRDVYLASLEATLDLGFATLTSSTSQYNHHGEITSENTGFYAQNDWYASFYYNYPRPMSTAYRTYGDKGVIEELRLVSAKGGAWDYIAGLYYQNQSLYSTQDSYLVGFQQWWDAAFPAYSSAVISSQDYLYRQHEHFREAALYGQLTFHPTDTVELTGGFRFFNDEDSVTVHQDTGVYASIFDSSDSGGTNGVYRGLFKGNAAWHFAPTDQVYATVAQGYRRGGSNGIPTTGNFAESPAWLSYQPDTDIDYEVGVKGRWESITYNADVFYVDWNNPQVNTATTNWGFFAVQNAKKATTKGVELQLAGELTPHWFYGFGYTYTDARLADDAISADGTYTINVAGAKLPGAPQQQINASTDYVIPLSRGKLTLHTDAYYQSSTEDTLFSSKVSLNTVPPPNPYEGEPKFYYPMPGFGIWNASASYALDSWRTILWIKNIANKEGVTGVYTPAYMGTSPQQNYFGNGSKASIALPRTVGLTLTYKF
jgi:outer membrane receptor protein involved in Fe transport